MRPSSVQLGFHRFAVWFARCLSPLSASLQLRREAAKFDSENRFRVGCGEGREQEAEEELERERRNAVAMAEHGGELAAEEPMKLASGFRIESNYKACTVPLQIPLRQSPSSPRPLSSPGSTSSTTPAPPSRNELSPTLWFPLRPELRYLLKGFFNYLREVSYASQFLACWGTWWWVLLAAIGALSGA